MRKPETIEHLYLDFDGFFASVMQQVMPALRGHPVGVVPHDVKDAQYTCVIACSREAKARGVKNVMKVPEALKICPEMKLVSQRPDLYRRAHHALLNEIHCEIPIGAVKSIDELACRMDRKNIADPHGLSRRIKARLRNNIGPYITCSIGMASNRLLAKMACKIDKPDGLTIWHPADMPGPILDLPLSEVPGVGRRMGERLIRAGIYDMQGLWDSQPKQLRALWGNVSGERMWYALHGYEVQAESTGRSMYGHGRVLAPEWRDAGHAESCSRLLLVKAARRMRNAGYSACRLFLWVRLRERGKGAQCWMPAIHDDFSVLRALDDLWRDLRARLTPRDRIIQVHVTLMDLVPTHTRQMEMFDPDADKRDKWERISSAVDGLNYKFGKRVLHLGTWAAPPGGYAGGKIAFTRIPSMEDFW